MKDFIPRSYMDQDLQKSLIGKELELALELKISTLQKAGVTIVNMRVPYDKNDSARQGRDWNEDDGKLADHRREENICERKAKEDYLQYNPRRHRHWSGRDGLRSSLWGEDSTSSKRCKFNPSLTPNQVAWLIQLLGLLASRIGSFQSPSKNRTILEVDEEFVLVHLSIWEDVEAHF